MFNISTYSNNNSNSFFYNFNIDSENKYYKILIIYKKYDLIIDKYLKLSKLNLQLNNYIPIYRTLEINDKDYSFVILNKISNEKFDFIIVYNFPEALEFLSNYNNKIIIDYNNPNVDINLVIQNQSIFDNEKVDYYFIGDNRFNIDSKKLEINSLNRLRSYLLKFNKNKSKKNNNDDDLIKLIYFNLDKLYSDVLNYNLNRNEIIDELKIYNKKSIIIEFNQHEPYMITYYWDYEELTNLLDSIIVSHFYNINIDFNNIQFESKIIVNINNLLKVYKIEIPKILEIFDRIY